MGRLVGTCAVVTGAAEAPDGDFVTGQTANADGGKDRVVIPC